ncbi:MAG: tail fiber domain-containing protein [Candidatus Delongbacteria bacterium]|nr:tail fiber domain-containing protein [Candidatus Delongbacteria bacterium]MCG2760719.1 tail fiber domain-containing protein [Candidatus Delongbacteria bacterium]
MKIFLSIILVLSAMIYAETLFEVKDASNNKVLDVSTDGLRILNNGDTLMVISPSGVRVNLDNSADKALSRTFTVATSTSKGKGFANVLEVGTNSTTMREGVFGDEYTNFSPENIFIGLNSGSSITPGIPYASHGKSNIFLGNESGLSNTTGYDNIMIGDSVGFSNISGYNNVFLGNTAGFLNNSGHRNVFIGFEAGYANTDKPYNTFVGAYAGRNSIGYENTFVGCMSGSMVTSGRDNSYFGFWSGSQNSTGNYNSIFGAGSGLCNVGGHNNTLMGFMAGVGSGVTNNSNNSLFGFESGCSINTGSNNVMIGSGSGHSNVSGAGNVFLGYQSGYSETLSNKLYIANSNTSTPLIKGTFPNTDLTFTTSRVSIIHPSGTTNGLYFQNTYLGNTDTWNIYQYTTDELALLFNGVKKGGFDFTSGVYTAVSDAKFKKNVEEYANILDKVMLLQPKKYNFISQKSIGQKYIGLIAQDVKELFPSFVYYSEEDDTYTMDYAGLSVVAIQAIKEQQAIISDQESRIKRLEGLVKQLIEK